MTDEECNFLMVSHQTLVHCLQFSPWPSAKDAAHLTASPSRLLNSGYNLQEHSKPNMYKSGVVDAENGGSSFSDIRTSTGSFVPKGG